MRVAHLGKYSFYKIGGVERHVVDLTVALAAKGVDVTVFSYDESGAKEPEIIDGVKVEPIPPMITAASQSVAPRLIQRLRALSRDAPFDVIHQHWPDPFAHLVASLMTRAPPHVVTWHMDIVRQRWLGPLYRSFAKRVLREPDVVVTSTKAHLRSEQLNTLAPTARKVVIPFGIHEQRYKISESVSAQAQEIREKFAPKPIVFALGRHVYYKGFSVLIKAMSRVDAVLLLGGTGPLSGELQSLARELDVRVVFLGSIPDDVLPSYFYASDVFCLPSCDQTEAFGLVQAEAMACGRPIVNTDLGNGVNELAPAGICALTVPVGDDRKLGAALAELLLDRNLATSLGEAGRSRIRQSYSVKSMVEHTLNVYNSLVNS